LESRQELAGANPAARETLVEASCLAVPATLAAGVKLTAAEMLPAAVMQVVPETLAALAWAAAFACGAEQCRAPSQQSQPRWKPAGW
jgi:hypothetical protein